MIPGARGVYRGPAEVRGWFEEVMLEAWESFHIDIEEITEASNGRVLAEGLIAARGRASGVETEIRVWGVFWLTDGKIARDARFFGPAGPKPSKPPVLSE